MTHACAIGRPRARALDEARPRSRSGQGEDTQCRSMKSAASQSSRRIVVAGTSGPGAGIATALAADGARVADRQPGRDGRGSTARHDESCFEVATTSSPLLRSGPA